MSGWGWFILIVILLIPISFAGYILYSRFRAKQNGLTPPPLSSYNPFAGRERRAGNYQASSGIVGWAKSKFQSLKGSGASRSGAYEQPLGANGRRGLDPDEAWDARVGAEADGYGAGGYYEEQELGLRPPGEGPYGGGGYGGHSAALPAYGEERERGRSLSREPSAYVAGGQKGLDERYDEEMGHDPFGDEAERSELRGVSPRPHEEDERRGHLKQGSGGGPSDESPTERRSMFHENV
ncbi:hypothetical protein ACLMJK_004349 [Lecanora helva]